MQTEEIRVRGLVQGVGFRPFVWQLAARFGIRGEVLNDGEGVLIRATGDQLDDFCRAILEEAPPLARIRSLDRRAIDLDVSPSGFSIVETKGGTKRTGVTPDAQVCSACRAEIAEPAERRHGYAFTNCTHCGPRFSIVDAIPYDRMATRMRAFIMCDACKTEYENPADRRFHAQPIACPTCGPKLTFLDRQGAPVDGDPLTLAAETIAAGGILALKGLGGFHLACDATNEAAVTDLRRRKRRPDKPFALMGLDLDMIGRHCHLTPAHAALLSEPAGPIVLMDSRAGGDALAPSLAPRLSVLGWMLPTTPLHQFLCAALARPLVMTSGNLSGEPQVIGNDEALEKLSSFADAFLLHDRDIARLLDDSVTAVVGGDLRVLRRARGYAPAPLELPPGFADAPPLLALGGELKSAICQISDGEALLSHHIGDLEDALSYSEFEKAIEDYARLFGHRPEIIACDLHPGYRSTAKAQEIAAKAGLPLLQVQHHHAHVASAMAENGWPLDGAPVLGIALDGTGYGLDGTVWGGELLLSTYRDVTRLGSLKPVPLPGGSAAVQEPWRNLLAQLTSAFGRDALPLPEGSDLQERLASKPVATLLGMMEKGLNSPMTSSAGRLFDAVGAALGLAFDRVSFEGQAAMELESLARLAVQPSDTEASDAHGYPFALLSEDDLARIDPAPMWRALLTDLADGVPSATIALRFHQGFATACADLAMDLARRHGAGAIALSGGVMQNALLMELLLDRLADCGLPVLTQRQVPANDGGLAYGQAVIAVAQALAGD
ncbi:Carbamoyltransferase HypF [Hartmannibacter diazotrophicus]|uniref:Carbamoyltransferase HypF n=1 Tax=Hartmannibacter diazotrophicus TaxID=1482074 RepID=A0A2C9D163_9HYPH|nr:carbamoyltransferase HypF [Hartmannibacter diazotrophicus]SON53963.1 Carbamoyltransferase HypF [Hartmannibacter diazotrophicus]